LRDDILKFFDSRKDSKKSRMLLKNDQFKEFLQTKYPEYNVEKDTAMVINLLRSNLSAIPKCANPECNNDVKFQDSKFGETCSYKCRTIVEKTNGMLEIKKHKYKKTCLKKYGVEHISQSQIIKDKIKKVAMKRYGVEYILQAPEVRNKIKKTNLERYGTDCILNLDAIKERIKQTNLQKYGVENTSQKHYSPETLIVLNDKVQLLDLLKEHGVFYLSKLLQIDGSTIRDYIKKYDLEYISETNRSGHERIISAELDRHQINYQIINKEILGGQELDFYFPDKKFAVEFCGLYWHGELKGKTSKYHYNKWKKCDELGINLFTIFEDEFIKNKQFWFNKILYEAGNCDLKKIGARSCEIRILNGKDKKIFLDKNHVQGDCGSVINLGLFYNNDLVSAMTFGNTRNNKRETIELSRFCSRFDIQVNGGASRLLSYFIKNYGDKYSEIISFSDNRYSSGKVYETLGFNLNKHIKADYSYVCKNHSYRFHKANFRKSNIQKKFNLDPEYVKSKTEWELMQELGYDRIWDCGKKKWSLMI
jgi:hypothetical protein